MRKPNHQRAQAITELAIFGAIVIFLLGTIVRTAVSNSYTQNQNLKAMRMAMLASWTGSKTLNFKTGTDPSVPPPDMSRNSASILFVEDRLSPDFSKYGDLDRNPYVISGSGSFSYSMLYPLDVNEVATELPIMDIYINGQHFPFTTASYVANRVLAPPVCAAGGPYENYPLSQAQCLQNQCLRNQREWYQPVAGGPTYKLFFTRVPNPYGATANTSPVFTNTPPVCANINSTNCMNKALSSTLTLKDSITGLPVVNNGDMQYDLLRNGDYAAVDTQFPSGGPMRNYIAWQWGATLASIQGNTTDGADPMLALDPDNNQYPTYDIDGRLKEMTIYTFSVTPKGYPDVSYEDPDGGDIDGLWDTTSCGPKPGLQTQEQIFTFTKNGTFLLISEGKMFDPESGQAVRSATKRDTIDLIQRTIQLSNNTFRFCSAANTPLATVGNDGVTPNPVEVCVNEGTPASNCFTKANIPLTCYDTTTNIIFVRSRLEDRRGNFWMTNTSGQLEVH